MRGVRTRLDGSLAGGSDAAHAARPRVQLPVDLTHPGVEQPSPLVMLAMQPLDQISVRSPALIIGVMAVAQHELAARGGMVPHAPASRLVTVEFLHQLIDSLAHRHKGTD